MGEWMLSSSSSPPRLPELARFEVVRPLGNGASGLVYEAIDRARGTRVALKVLRSLHAEAILQLKAEFRALQDIAHPNLIRLDELIRDGDVWFFTMELVAGVDFHEHVTGAAARADLPSGVRKSRAPASERGAVDDAAAARCFDEAKLRDALVQLARGLVALHAAGKVHRDIKPSNVLVRDDGRVVVLDFGLVSEAKAIPEDYVVGTARYLAPEQGAGEDIDPAADWYSVGVVLYLCLTGRHPFEGSAEQVLMQKMTEDPPAPSAIAEGVPPDLDALCMELLAREPSDRPRGTEILARLTHAASARPSVSPRGPSARPSRSPFVGRAAEMAAIAHAFDDARAGRTVVVVVEGESGVGKSALVARCLADLAARAPDAQVLAGRCYEREAVPYKAIDGVVDVLSQRLAAMPSDEARALLPGGVGLLLQVFPVLQRVDAAEGVRSAHPAIDVESLGLQEGRARLFTAVRMLFARLAARAPLVVVIDDLQWADADSLALLAELLQPPDAPPLLLLATARGQDARAEGAAPFGLPGDVRLLPLARLREEEGLELARRLLDGASTPVDAAMATAIAREAAGHPLFVDELVRHALAFGEAPAVLALDDALYARVARLDAGARRLLEHVAVAGVALAEEVARFASGATADELPSHLRALAVAHLARTDEGRVEAYHDRVREAVVSRIPGEERPAVHERLARALEREARPDADALATHWLAAGDRDRARVYMLRAADQAYRALAFDRAASLYDRALALSPDEDEQRASARIRLAEALANTGRGVEAARAYGEAARRAPREQALDLRRCAAEQLLNAGRFDEGDAALHEVLAAVGMRLPRSPLTALVGLLALRAWLFVRGMRTHAAASATVSSRELTRLDACAGVAELLGVVDTIRGAYFQTKTLLYALHAGEPARLAHALALEGAFLTGTGARGAPQAARVFARAEALAIELGTPQSKGAVEGSRAFSRFCQGHFREARALADAAVTTIRERPVGAFWDLRMSQMIAMWSLSWTGEVGELARRLDRQLRDADARGDLYAATCMRAGPPTIAWLRGDDPRAARDVVHGAMRLWTQRGYHNQHYWALLAEAQIDLYEGKGRAAYDRVIAHWPRMQRSLMLEVQIIRLEATNLRARAALATAVAEEGNRDALLRSAARDARRLVRSDAPYAQALGWLLQGSIAAFRKRGGDARDRFAAALARFEALGMQLHAEATRLRLAELDAGEAAAAVKARVSAWCREQGVASPERMMAMVAPRAP